MMPSNGICFILYYILYLTGKAKSVRLQSPECPCKDWDKIIMRLVCDDYIDVGDGCWTPNVSVTSLRCW